VWDPLDPEHVDAYTAGNMMCDMFVTLLPMKQDTNATKSFWKSLTGVMPHSLGVTAYVNDIVYYEGCEAVAAHWNWKDASDYSSQRYRITNDNVESNAKFNVICMQEVQFKYDPSTDKYSNCTEDQGHWGNKIYTGCGAVRKGLATHLETPWYHQTKTIQLGA